MSKSYGTSEGQRRSWVADVDASGCLLHGGGLCHVEPRSQRGRSRWRSLGLWPYSACLSLPHAIRLRIAGCYPQPRERGNYWPGIGIDHILGMPGNEPRMASRPLARLVLLVTYRTVAVRARQLLPVA